MGLIDEKGAKAISNWNKDTSAKESHNISILIDDNIPLVLKVDNDIEKSNLKLILMKNRIKFNENKIIQN
jgi:hypothetical protein